MRIIETDNFGRDYPSETFLNLPPLNVAHAQAIVDAINNGFPESYPRFWRVVEDSYILCPGFEP